MVNPSFVATHHTTLRREYPPQTSRVISSDIYLFSIGLTALLFVDTGAIRSLSSQPLTTAFLTRMVLAQRVPSLFTAAQILRDAPLSVLHFFSPLGAGGAGATLRRVRAAYSRTRCLPHPKGWAYTPTGRFCVARTYCSPHFSAHIASVRTAGRRGLSLSRTKIERLRCPLLWAFCRTQTLLKIC